MSDSGSEDSQDGTKKRAKTAYDLQRISLEKLMQNANKEVFIPDFEKKSDKLPRAFHTHEFVRNVMGASAGAGSGEFDIYRGCRRRELLRQEFLEEKSINEKLNKEFEEKRLSHLKEAEEKTAKKRAKRLKQKMKKKQKGDNKSTNEMKQENENSSDQSNTEELDLDEKVNEEAKKEHEISDKMKIESLPITSEAKTEIK